MGTYSVPSFEHSGRGETTKRAGDCKPVAIDCACIDIMAELRSNNDFLLLSFGLTECTALLGLGMYSSFKYIIVQPT
jgi:hypothetical protein